MCPVRSVTYVSGRSQDLVADIREDSRDQDGIILRKQWSVQRRQSRGSASLARRTARVVVVGRTKYDFEVTPIAQLVKNIAHEGK